MLAVDTNIVVRYLTADDAVQSRKARKLIEGQDIFVSISVLLELEWVLRSAYRLGPALINQLIGTFVGLPTVLGEDQARLATALAWHARGMDFADAVHLAGSAACEAMATFDAALAKDAKRLGAFAVRII